MSLASPKAQHPSTNTDANPKQARHATGKNSIGRECLIGALVASILAIFVLQLWQADLRIPMSYLGDAVALGATVKGVIENTWFLHNPSLGAPFGRNFADYPMSDYVHLFLLKALGTVGPNFGWAMNVYFLLSFPLTTAASHWVLRRLGISFWPSLVASTLFSFLPFRFYRGTAHLFYSAYYIVPFVLYASLRLAIGKGLIEARSDDEPRWWWRRRSFWFTTVLTVIIAGNGVYSVLFSTFFIGLGALYGAVRFKTLRPLRTAAGMSCGLIVCTLLATLPTLLYAHEHGKNSAVAARIPAEAEHYGLRVTQLLMPIDGHRLGAFGALRRKYDAEGTAIPPNENGAASLGIVGAIGFLILVLYLVGWRERNQNVPLLPVLSTLAVWGVLLATIGGLSGIIALLITPNIRGYNRISVYIGFLALAAIAVVLDALLQQSNRMRRWVYVALPVVLIGGVWDQTSTMHVPDYVTLKRVYSADQEFVRRIEQHLRPGSMVFQLPHVPWPEHPGVHSVSSYDHFRGYLHSQNLRWSYGAMRGRPGDVWIQNIGTRPIPEMMDLLAIAGFEGIYLDTRGYPDREIQQRITEVVGPPSIIDSDGLRVFFSLAEHTRVLKASYPQEHWDRMRNQVLHPTVATWLDGCSFLEHGPDGSTWRWCEDESTLALYNSDAKPRSIRMRANVMAGSQRPSQLSIEAGGLSRTVHLPAAGETYIEAPVTLAPGTTFIRFRSDAPALVAPGDPRKLVLRFTKLSLSDGDAPDSFEWESGCSQKEKAGLREWRWCSDAAALVIRNQGSAAKQVAIGALLRVGTGQPGTFQLTGPGFSQTFNADKGTASIRRIVSLPAGVSRWAIRTDAKPLEVSSDPRKLVFSVDSFHAVDLSSSPTIYSN